MHRVKLGRWKDWTRTYDPNKKPFLAQQTWANIQAGEYFVLLRYIQVQAWGREHPLPVVQGCIVDTPASGGVAPQKCTMQKQHPDVGRISIKEVEPGCPLGVSPLLLQTWLYEHAPSSQQYIHFWALSWHLSSHHEAERSKLAPMTGIRAILWSSACLVRHNT